MKRTAVYLVIFFILVLSFLSSIKHTSSITNEDFTKPITCSDVFGNCNSTLNDTAEPSCSGIAFNADGARVEEVYLNASAVIPGGWIECNLSVLCV